MPIYDYTYQSWKGERRGPLFRWLAIPKFALMEVFSSRVFLWLFAMAWAHFLFRLAWVYLLINTEFFTTLGIKAVPLPPADAAFFKSMVDIQIFFCVLFAFMLGANLISRDLAHNALVLYVSKPISRWEYFFGKFSLIFFMTLLLTWVQASLLFVLLVAASPAESEWRTMFWSTKAPIFVSMTVYSLVIAASISLLILAASSLSKNGRKAGLIFAIYIIGTLMLTPMIVELTHMRELRAISILRATANLGFHLFDLPARSLVSPTAAWTSILGNWALCGLIIHWRMSNAAKHGR